jgi:hypothetical protein
MASSPGAHRSWYKLHLSTWIVFLWIGISLAYQQFIFHWVVIHGMRAHYNRGYPFLFMEDYLISGLSSWATPFVIERPINFVKDLGIWLLLSTMTLIFWERLARVGFRFSLKAMFAVLTTGALIFPHINWRSFLNWNWPWHFTYLGLWASVFFSIMLLLWMLQDVCTRIHQARKKGKYYS